MVNGIWGDIVHPALLAPLFLQSEEKQKRQQQQNHFLCSVAGVPSKLSNSGRKASGIRVGYCVYLLQCVWEVWEMKSQLGDEKATSDVVVSFKLAMNVS